MLPCRMKIISDRRYWALGFCVLVASVMAPWGAWGKEKKKGAPTSPKATPRTATPRTTTQRTATQRTTTPRTATQRTATQRTTTQRTTTPRLFKSLLDTVHKRYFQPKRFLPKKMFVAAVRALESEVPSLLTTVSGSTLLLQIQGSRLEAPLKETFHLATMEQWAFRVAAFVLRSTKGSKGSITPKKLQRVIFSAMLKTFDPHSTYFPPNRFKGIEEALLGATAGIGVEVARKKSSVVLKKVYFGAPAHKAGLREGDILLRAGELEFADLPLSLVRKTLRGKKNTILNLLVSRKRWRRPRLFKMARKVVEIPSVKARYLGDGIGAIHITDFKVNTPKAFKRELRNLVKQGARGLVLDLRGNGGGIVGSVIKVGDFLVDQGVLLESVGRDGRVLKRWEAKKQNTLFRGTLVVLVDAKTASAGEILSGTLKATGRAVLMGERTWGKGTAQEIFHTSDGGAYKITTFQFRVEGAQSLHLVGVTPHVLLKPVGAVESGLHAFHLFRRDDEATRWRPYGADISIKVNGTPTRGRPGAQGKAPKKKESWSHPRHTLLFLMERHVENGGENKGGAQKERRPKVQKPYGVIGLAAELVRALVKAETEKKKDLQNQVVDKWFQKANKRELTRAVAFFASRGVKWSAIPTKEKKGPSAQGPSAQESLDLSLSVDKDRVRADEKVTFTLKITNRGSTLLRRGGGILRASRPWIDGLEFVVGDVHPKESKEAKVTLRVPLDVVSHTVRVDMELIAQGDTTGVQLSRLLEVVGRPRPRFHYSVMVDDRLDRQKSNQGNGNGILEPGEKGTLFVRLKNDGGAASHVRVDVVEATDPVLVTKPRVLVSKLGAGAEAVAAVPVSFSRRGKQGYVPTTGSVTLVVYDNYLGGHLKAELPVAASSSEFGCQRIQGRAKTLGQVTLRSAARESSPKVGTLESGASVALEARCSAFYRVSFGEKGFAFVSKNELTDLKENVEENLKEKTKGFVPHYTVSPPLINATLSDDAKSETVTIKGSLSHPKGISDFWVVTWSLDRLHPKGDKVFYKALPKESLKGSVPHSFSVKIPVRGGSQLVAVVARSSDGIRSLTRRAFYRVTESVKPILKVGSSSKEDCGPPRKTGTKKKSSPSCGCLVLGSRNAPDPLVVVMLFLLSFFLLSFRGS